MNAGEALYANDVADPETIDLTWSLATEAPLGPFRILDIVGLETAYNIVCMDPAAKDPETTPGKIAKRLKEKIDAGKKGVCTGEGFYFTQSKKYDRQDMFPDGFDVWKVIW